MLAFLKETRLYSIFNNVCPNCHVGKFYIGKQAYDFKHFGKNYDKCSNCGFVYEKEPGFFYGAMYASYAISIAFSVAIAVAIFVLFPSSSYLVYIISIVLGLILLMPLSYWLSRLVWLNLFTHYHKHKENL